jgi:hypothetical protein
MTGWRFFQKSIIYKMASENTDTTNATGADIAPEPVGTPPLTENMNTGHQRRATVDHIDMFIRKLWEGKIYMKKESVFDQDRWEFCAVPEPDACVQIQIDKRATFRTSDTLYFSFNYAPPEAGVFEGFPLPTMQQYSDATNEASTSGQNIPNPGSRIDTELVPISTRQFSEEMLDGLRILLSAPAGDGDDDSSSSGSEPNNPPSQSESGGDMHPRDSSDEDDDDGDQENAHVVNHRSGGLVHAHTHVSGGETMFDNSDFTRAIVINMNAASQVLNINTSGINGNGIGPLN